MKCQGVKNFRDEHFYSEKKNISNIPDIQIKAMGNVQPD